MMGMLAQAQILYRISGNGLQKNLMLPDGKTIKDVLTEDEFKRLDEGFAKLTGTALSSEQMFNQMGRLTPTMLTTTISMFFVMQQKPKFMDLNNGIDTYVQMMGRQRGKGCIGLETMEFQSKRRCPR